MQLDAEIGYHQANERPNERSMTQILSRTAGEATHGTIISKRIAINAGQIVPRTLVSGFVASVDAPPLDAPLDPAAIAAIHAAWRDHPVLVFPRQKLDPNALAFFSSQLGEFGVDPYVRATEAHQNVIEIRREPRETAPIFGHSWHSDWSFQSQPPSATLLQSHELPPQGGDTLFASGYRAFESLSPAMQTLLTPLKGIHSARAAYGPRGLFAKDDETRSMKIVVSEDAERSCLHPIVRTHPGSGKKTLYINHVYTVGIDGFKEAESSSLLGFLFRHMSQHSFTYRHRWQDDTLLMWDNRCVIHCADGGYQGHRRVLYRTTLAGERPY